jgi:DNA-binding transcriptional LysR family regulator
MRSVSPTEAGEHVLRTIGPRFEEIDAELEALSAFREKPSDTIRITAGDHAIHSHHLAPTRRLGRPDSAQCR